MLLPKQLLLDPKQNLLPLIFEYALLLVSQLCKQYAAYQPIAQGQTHHLSYMPEEQGHHY